MGDSTLHVPSASSVVVKVCILPSLSVTKTVIKEPSGAPSTRPTKVGVVSLVSAMAVTVISGLVKSTNPCSTACASLPAVSVTVALTSNSPCAKGVETLTDQLPSSFVCVNSV
ncbi:hypothetical protein PSAT104721_11305 [Pseudoalteromonas atlantica]